MKKILTTILAIALFAALATVAFTIAMVLLGLFAIWWVYLYFTGRKMFASFEEQLRQQMGAQPGEASPMEPLDGQTIEAEYEVVEEETKP